MSERVSVTLTSGTRCTLSLHDPATQSELIGRMANDPQGFATALDDSGHAVTLRLSAIAAVTSARDTPPKFGSTETK